MYTIIRFLLNVRWISNIYFNIMNYIDSTYKYNIQEDIKFLL